MTRNGRAVVASGVLINLHSLRASFVLSFLLACLFFFFFVFFFSTAFWMLYSLPSNEVTYTEKNQALMHVRFAKYVAFEPHLVVPSRWQVHHLTRLLPQQVVCVVQVPYFPTLLARQEHIQYT